MAAVTDRCTHCGTEGHLGKTLQRVVYPANGFKVSEVVDYCRDCLAAEQERVRRSQRMDPGVKWALIIFAVIFGLCLLFEGLGEVRAFFRRM